jgi:hypothetical protein
VKLLEIAMIGFSKSPSFMPVARHSARAPAMLRPAVEVRERYWGMMSSGFGRCAASARAASDSDREF